MEVPPVRPEWTQVPEIHRMEAVIPAVRVVLLTVRVFLEAVAVLVPLLRADRVR